jgi:hypothetical protein
MKKFWKINFNSDTKQSLEFLSVDKDYILIVMDKTSDIMKCKNDDGHKYFFICHNDEGYNHHMWGWGEENDEKWFYRNDYFYCGEVNLRKEKLKKLNDTIRRMD